MHAASDMSGPLSVAWAIPFAGLLLSIAVAPLIASRLWHHHYGKAATLWALAFLVPDAVLRGATTTITGLIAVALHEYLPFILLLGALFTVAGGLRVKGTLHGTPAVNALMLAMGAAMASFIGTTGATMVMLRPVIRANRNRARPTHVFVFFILLVANVGGALSPLGDPPLFLGYLLGVPFFWPAIHLALPTLLLAAILLALFYGLDSLLHRRSPSTGLTPLAEIETLGLDGKANLVLLAATIGVVLLRALWNPTLGVSVLGIAWSLDDMIADGLLVVIAALSLALTPASVRKANDFVWEPIVEVAILFAAIFITLQPVTAMIAEGKDGPLAALIVHLYADGAPNHSIFYWATGALSAFLDNAPTYVVFFGFAGGDPAQLSGPLSRVLMAISSGAVYFGAMTYIGNAPNFMVKAMVESQGLKMPSFFGYLGWSCLCLLPWLVVIDVLFFIL